MKRQSTVRILASLLLCTLLVSEIGLPRSEAAPVRAPVVIGSGAVGQHALEIVGRIDQNAGTFTSFGYLIHIRGVADSRLFTSATVHSEATARFTFYATGRLVARSVLGTLFSLTSRGTFSIHASPTAGATFENPASFRRGSTVATISARLQTVVNVQAPNTGILTLWGEGTQRTARTLSLQGRTYRLGRVGQREQIAATGQGIRLEPTAPRAVFNVAGNFAVTGR